MAEDKALKLGQEPPKMTILSDRPSESVGEDLLGMESRLSAVLDILRHKLTKCPIAVAIYGDWGTGKTSAMHWLKSQLETWNKLDIQTRGSHPRVYPIWFDPWKYHTREDVWRGIISEVILSLFDAKNLDRQDFVPRMKEAARKFGAFLGKGFLHALSNTELSLKAEAGVPGIAGGSELKFSGEMFREIYEEFDRANHPEKAYLNQFEDALKSWVESFLKNDARISLFIDDLDRCLPEVTLEVLEAIKLYLNIPQIIFVVGLDRSVVDSVVVKHYELHGLGKEKAEKYLDKIFQVEVQISPSQTQMTDFHKKQIKHLDESTGGYWGKTLAHEHRIILEEGVSELAKGNPRELKRLLNSALLRGRAAADNAILGQKTESTQLFAQGVQVFLVQKIVQKRFGISTSLLLKTPVLNWFERWSRFVKENPGFNHSKSGNRGELLLPKDREGTLKRAGQDSPVETKGNPMEIGFQSIANEPLIGEDGKPLDKELLLGEELLWKLLEIPFSTEVAQSTPNLEASKIFAEVIAGEPQTKGQANQPKGPASNLDDLIKLPDLVRRRVAKELDKPVDQLTVVDYATITNLDFTKVKITDSDLEHVANLQSLQSLDLNQTTITNAGLKYLRKLPNLKSLNLFSTSVGDEGLEHLESLHSLQTLDVGNNGSYTLRAWKTLGKITSLEQLLAWNTGKCNEGVKYLETLKSLKNLDLSYSIDFDDVGMKHLGKLEALESLSVSMTRISDAGLDYLENLKSLKTLDLSFTHITNAGLERLQKTTSLRHLDLHEAKSVTHDGVKKLKQSCPELTVRL